MKFTDLEYQELSQTEIEKSLSELNQKIIAAKTGDDLIDAFLELNDYRAKTETQFRLANIKYTVNTNEAYFAEQKKKVGQITPHYGNHLSKAQSSILTSAEKQQLENKYGSHLLNVIEANVSVNDEKIVPLRQQENELVTQYMKLISSAQIEVNGSTYNLSTINKQLQSEEERTRKAAFEALWGYYAENQTKLESFYDKMVKVRHEIGTTLNEPNYTPIAYKNMWRLDYGPAEVAQFRTAVLTHIVPIVSGLQARQAKRFGKTKLEPYNKALRYPSGNPTPQGNAEWIQNTTKGIFDTIDTDLGNFYQQMLDDGFFDLMPRDGKSPGGYCSYIPLAKAPFVFANFTGTFNDVRVLIHEMGHAYNSYLASRAHDTLNYAQCSLETAEVHSMSLELFAGNHIEPLFGPDTQKFQFGQISMALEKLPMMCCVDAFQHAVYENPSWSPEARNQHWKDLEQQFQPNKESGGMKVLEDGAGWFPVTHIFRRPFYYIDYALAQVCALQYWVWMQEDFKAAWKSYDQLLRIGGSMPFQQALQTVGLESPFKTETIAKVAAAAKVYLDGVDEAQIK